MAIAPASDSYLADISSLIELATTILQLLLFVLWLHITSHHVGDIANASTRIVDRITAGEDGRLRSSVLAAGFPSSFSLSRRARRVQ